VYNWSARIPLPSTLVLSAAVVYLLQSVLSFNAETVFTAVAGHSDPDETPTREMRVEPIDLTEFSESLERPIFAPTRRPYVREADVPSTKLQPVDTPEVLPDVRKIRLLGTMDVNGVPAAFLENASGRQWVKTGDQFYDWTVASIKSGEVTLKLDEVTYNKTLFE